jgi:hypothetical protein
MKASLNPAAPSRVPPTYLIRLEIQPNPISAMRVFTTMCKKTKKVAMARGGRTHLYLIDNKGESFLVDKDVRKMHFTIIS